MGATLLGGALVLSAGAGALAAGVPLLFMPAPLIAAAGLALYYKSGMLQKLPAVSGRANKNER